VLDSTLVELSAPGVPGPSTGPGTVEDQVALLTAVADPVRLALLDSLTGGTTCVCELQTRVPVAANLLSYHLKVLREAGLVSGARRGRWIDYSLVDGALERLHAALPTSGTGGRR
jgi:ArsR family transcriptional regulator